MFRFKCYYRIGGVVVSVFVSSVGGSGWLDPQQGRTKGTQVGKNYIFLSVSITPVIGFLFYCLILFVSVSFRTVGHIF